VLHLLADNKRNVENGRDERAAQRAVSSFTSNGIIGKQYVAATATEPQVKLVKLVTGTQLSSAQLTPHSFVGGVA
jgi:hypothetical protein